MAITQAEVKRAFHYNPTNGQFTWLEYVEPGRKKRRHHGLGAVGTRAGSITKKGYRTIRYNDVRYYEHHLVWLYVFGYFPVELDHVNGDGTDNSLKNLREATRSQQSMNTAIRKDNRTGFRGVSRRKNGTYFASIRILGKTKYLGVFKTAELASVAYKKEAQKLFNTFIRT